ncbi:MAG TPA: class I SAM-dependent methyltransferase [Gemmatimonadaceae bacterium]|nr:class I SAM-dependent methyltransferase [Gemmatimonadaceae bacterium]
MDRKAHWERVYATKRSTEMSWYQQQPARSLELLAQTGLAPDSAIIDVGGGDSTLVDTLVERRLGRVTVLDLSGAALARARARLGSRAGEVTWLEADVTRAELGPQAYDFWHDRAVFHFLTDAEDRRAYVDQVRRSVKPGGHVLVATFAEDAPARCSGLPVVRYSADSLHSEFGPEFHMLTSEREDHRTPWGTAQPFLYCLCRRE